jgi:hypothetical protein
MFRTQYKTHGCGIAFMIRIRRTGSQYSSTCTECSVVLTNYYTYSTGTLPSVLKLQFGFVRREFVLTNVSAADDCRGRKIATFCFSSLPQKTRKCFKNKRKMPLLQIKEQDDLDYYTTIYQGTTVHLALPLPCRRLGGLKFYFQKTRSRTWFIRLPKKPKFSKNKKMAIRQIK